MEEGDHVQYTYPGFKDHMKGHVIQVDGERAYVHFDGYDRRLDRYIPISELTKIVEKKEKEEDTQTEDGKSEGKNDNKGPSKEIQTMLEEERQKIRNFDTIYIGKHKIDAWYFSPYPIETDTRSLHVCEFCMKYFPTQQELKNHYAEAQENRIPGREIYRKDDISIFEVKGKKQKLFCQCLSLLGKVFIEHKASFYDVDQFIYYVLCECDEKGTHVAAFYSVEQNMTDNNLSCIVVLPPYQKKGYGRILISLSYQIALRSGIISGPERPLSDLGHAAYLAFWKDTAMQTILKYGDETGDLAALAARTSIAREDLAEALSAIGVCHRVGRSMPLIIDFDAAEGLRDRYRSVEMKPHIDPDYLLWFKKGTFH